MTRTSIPERIARLYGHDGPFVTAYLDGTRSDESGSREVELRWRELRATLTAAGAEEKSLAALDDAAITPSAVPGRHGQTLVAAGGEMVFAEVLPDPPDRPQATVSPLPDMVPFLAQSGPRIAYVLVVADHTGADLVAVPPDWAGAGRRPHARSVEGGRPYPVHKTGRDEWDERHFQHRVENSWAANARDVAAEVRVQVEAIDAELVVLAGDPRARALLREDLPAVLRPDVELAEVEAGGRAEGSSEQSLDEAVHEALLQRSWRQRREVLGHLQQNLGRDRFAVAGAAEVLEAVRRSQVDTVVLSDDRSSTLTAWVGPEPLQLGLSADELRAMGVDDPQQDRFDAALLRALAGSGAGLLVTPNAHEYLPEGIAALLRYDDESTHS